MIIIMWLIIGVVTALAINIADPVHAKGGKKGSLILGVIGAIIGGSIGLIVFSSLYVISIVSSVLGAALMTLFQRIVLKDDTYIKTKISI